MKRKLDTNDEPLPVLEAATEAPSAKETTTNVETFADLGLDARLLQAISGQRFQKPTLVQSKAIPLALDGHDVIAKARTGSGKTAAYVLPILQGILKRKKQTSSPFLAALILVPTRELADQVTRVIDSFSAFCAKEVQTVKLSEKVSDAVARSLLSNSPDIVVATPSRAWHNIKNSSLSLEHLAHLVLDEADLVLSYGYNEDLQGIAESMPKGVQTSLMSATLTAEVTTLKGIFCRNPTLLDLEETEAEGEGVTQYVVKTKEDEKFLLIYVLIKLQLIKGKVIIFVSDPDRCYRLKLFCEQFGIRSCVLNSELPLNSRIHTIQEFNVGTYDIIIASDENEIMERDDAPKQEEEAESSQSVENPGKSGSSKDVDVVVPPKKKQKSARQDKEYSVARGQDFVEVACVINFDLPTSAKSYTHRIGRTARASQTGMALSFVVPAEHYRKHMPTTTATAENDEVVLARIIKQQAKKGKEVKPYTFDMKQVDSFRYRMNDALRAVTNVAVREARVRELRQELMKSEKLKRHFEENPVELSHLRHDGELRSARTQAHLKHVPDYLLPAEGKKALTANEIGFVPFKKNRDGKGKKGKSFKGRGKKMVGRKADPLKSFRGKPRSK